MSGDDEIHDVYAALTKARTGDRPARNLAHPDQPDRRRPVELLTEPTRPGERAADPRRLLWACRWLYEWRPTRTLPPSSWRVLAAWSDGRKVEGIAEHVGVSRRTVARRLAYLADEGERLWECINDVMQAPELDDDTRLEVVLKIDDCGAEPLVKTGHLVRAMMLLDALYPLPYRPAKRAVLSITATYRRRCVVCGRYVRKRATYCSDRCRKRRWKR